MKFDRIAPCDECPFTTGGVPLRPERIGEIAQRLIVEPGSGFPCHKTVNHGRRRRADESQCIGAVIFLTHLGVRNLWLHLAQRVGGLDLRRLRGRQRVYRSLSAWIKGGSH